MDLWKIAIVLLIGAAFTKDGRQTLRRLIKEVIKTSESAVDKGSSILSDLRAQTTELIEEVKTEQKKATDGAKKQVEANQTN